MDLINSCNSALVPLPPKPSGAFLVINGPSADSGANPRSECGWNTNTTVSDGDTHSWFYERRYKCAARKSQVADVMWSGIATCLISERVLKLFRDAKLTGYDVRPADVRLMYPHDPKDAVFWQLVVTGWGGVAPAESGIRRIDDPEGLGRLTYTHCTSPTSIVDPSRWDGSDFFLVWPLPNFWWITSRVADLLRYHKLKRYHLVPPSELTFGIQVGAVGFEPGRLRHYFTEERATEIGEPLGIY